MSKDLIDKLRDTASKGVSVWGDIQMEAADEIERLQNEATAWAATVDNLTAERDALKADAAPVSNVPDSWKQAVSLAYGHLWHVNNEPMAPVPMRSDGAASYAARKLLRDLLTKDERGLAINEVRTMLEAAPQPKDAQ